MEQYDVVVLGSGPGGYVAAIRAAQLGMKTALVEKDPLLGGTCLHRGCIPTKALLEVATIYEKIKHSSDFGIVTSGVSLDLAAVHKRKKRIVTKLAKGIEYLMRKNQVRVLQGTGKAEGGSGGGKELKGGHGLKEVGVTLPDGSSVTLSARNLILATGSIPKVPGSLEAVYKSHGNLLLTSDEILNLTSIPDSLIVIGAGAVGVEFASLFHRFGSRVTLVEMMPRIVPLEDEEISRELERSFVKQGIRVMTGTSLHQLEPINDGVKVKLKTGEGLLEESFRSSLLAIGRVPCTAGIGLESLKVDLEKGFVRVNEFMEAGEAGVYAIGDLVAGTPLLAHKASAEGILAVEHMAGLEVRPLNYRHVPGCTFCTPEIGSVGLTEAEAIAAGYQVKVGRFPYAANSKAAILGEQEGMVKMVSDARYDEVLGVHIIGPKATELIAEACVALRLEATTEEIVHTIHAHPTLSEIMVEAAHGVSAQPLHI